MAKARFGETEDHYRRSSALIYNNFAGFGDEGLRSVDIQDIQASGLEDFMDLCQLTGMFDIAVSPA